jgi:hypothetical protein
MKACRRVCGLSFLPRPPRRATPPPQSALHSAGHALAVGTHEYGPVQALADGQVDRSGGAQRERDGGDLAALPEHGLGAVPALKSKLVDVGTDRF